MSDRTLLPNSLVAAIGLVAVLALSACAGGESPDASSPGPSDRPTRTDPVVEPVASESAPGVVGEVPDDILDRILADASDRTGAAAEAIEVTRAEAVTWSDGSLDCPEPGMLYTQALVDGYDVVLDAAGTELDYRATTNGDYRLCESPGRPAGG